MSIFTLIMQVGPVISSVAVMKSYLKACMTTMT